MLSDEQIKEFQTLYENCFGKKISQERAYAEAVKFLRLMELIYEPMTIKQHKQLQDRRKKYGQ